MKIIINIILILGIAALGYMLYTSIKAPIEFKAEKIKRENAVKAQLGKVEIAQKLYKVIKDKYAGSFDSLIYVLKTDTLKIPVKIGDPDDPNSEVRIGISEIPAIDTIKSLGIDLDKLALVPFSDSKKFSISSGSIEDGGIEIAVFEVSTPIATYMGPFADPKYTQYDRGYKPDELRKIGDMNKQTTSGNW